MENKLVVRFFDVTRGSVSDPTLVSLLEATARIKDLVGRERDLTPSVRVRLERLQKDGNDHIAGEITRIQHQNMPSEVHPDGTRPLSVSTPLGHGVAFRYNTSKNILAVQFDTRILGPTRIIQYLTEVGGNSSIKLKPLLRRDMWERFAKGETRKFEITVVGPEALSVLDNPNEPVAKSIRLMGEAYDAPRVNIVVSMGNKKGALRSSITAAIKNLFDAASTGTIAVERMKATIDGDLDKDERHIDFINELLSKTFTLELPENNPDHNYRKRKAALQQAMNENDC